MVRLVLLLLVVGCTYRAYDGRCRAGSDVSRLSVTEHGLRNRVQARIVRVDGHECREQTVEVLPGHHSVELEWRWTRSSLLAAFANVMVVGLITRGVVRDDGDGHVIRAT